MDVATCRLLLIGLQPAAVRAVDGPLHFRLRRQCDRPALNPQASRGIEASMTHGDVITSAHAIRVGDYILERLGARADVQMEAAR